MPTVGRPKNNPGQTVSGDAIYRNRRACRPRLSRAKLGEAAGVSERTVARWEKGELVPSREQLRAVAKALGVRLSDLAKKTGGN